MALFAVIGAMVVLWWLRPSDSPGRPRIAFLTTPTRDPASQQLVMVGGTAENGTGGPDVSGDAVVTGSVTLTDTLAIPSEATPRPATGTPPASATPQVTSTPAPTPTTYKVKNGETLQVIADRFNTTVNAIIAANNLSADGFIRAGDDLQIPAAGQAASQTSAPKPTATPTGGTLIYRVSEGDTVAGIAERYGSSIEWILQANKLKEDDFLSIGQSLLIPLSNSTPQPIPTGTPGPSTPTPTAGTSMLAPVLVGPVEGAVVAADSDALLSWTSTGVLGESEWYVVKLATADGKAVVAPYWTKSTSWRLSPEFRMGGQGGATAAASPAATPVATQYMWQVQVMSGGPGKPGKELSPASPVHHFTWR